jgi:hypothetical protein
MYCTLRSNNSRQFFNLYSVGYYKRIIEIFNIPQLQTATQWLVIPAKHHVRGANLTFYQSGVLNNVNIWSVDVRPHLWVQCLVVVQTAVKNHIFAIYIQAAV